MDIQKQIPSGLVGAAVIARSMIKEIGGFGSLDQRAFATFTGIAWERTKLSHLILVGEEFFSEQEGEEAPDQVEDGLKPSDLNPDKILAELVFEDKYVEKMARRIVTLCQTLSDEEWRAFSWKDYKEKFTRLSSLGGPEGWEQDALNILLAKEYLAHDGSGEDLRYRVTSEFLKAISAYRRD